MTNKREALLDRLAEIGQALAGREDGLGLLGLGSVGQARARLDEYSDLDFFAVVAPGAKGRYLADLSWLSDIAPVAYAFQNTPDGFKLLFADGIFCEFAVFEPAELAQAAYTDGVWVWRRAGFVGAVSGEGKRPLSSPPDPEYLLGEALTNLYVGLGRYHRGEKLAAMRFIQVYAVDQVIALAAGLESEKRHLRDPFAGERRVEQRLPALAQWLPAFTPGYNHSRAAAKRILTFLDAHFSLNPALKTEILKLCG